MQRVVILHGRPDEDRYFSEDVPAPSNSHWLPWLQNQLMIRGFDAQTPQVHEAFRADNWSTWATELDRHVVDEPTTFVGYSCGGGVMVRWLSEHPEVKIDKLLLVAPWLDVERRDTTDFFEFTIDPELYERTNAFHLFYSHDDTEPIKPTIDLLLSRFPDVTYHQYDDKQHFRASEMGTERFPDLLDAIVA